MIKTIRHILETISYESVFNPRKRERKRACVCGRERERERERGRERGERARERERERREREREREGEGERERARERRTSSLSRSSLATASCLSSLVRSSASWWLLSCCGGRGEEWWLWWLAVVLVAVVALCGCCMWFAVGARCQGGSGCVCPRARVRVGAVYVVCVCCKGRATLCGVAAAGGAVLIVVCRCVCVRARVPRRVARCGWSGLWVVGGVWRGAWLPAARCSCCVPSFHEQARRRRVWLGTSWGSLFGVSRQKQPSATSLFAAGAAPHRSPPPTQPWPCLPDGVKRRGLCRGLRRLLRPHRFEIVCVSVFETAT
jgi:hypothetical protein